MSEVLAGVTLATSVTGLSSIFSVSSVLSRVTPLARVETNTLQVAVLSPALAVIFASPLPTAFTLPLASTVATLSLLLLQVTVLSVAPSGVTLATSVTGSSSTVRSSSVSSRVMPVTSTVTFTVQVAVLPPAVAVIFASPLPTAVTLPSSSTVATFSLLVSQNRVLSEAYSGPTSAVRVAVPVSAEPAIISRDVLLSVTLFTG